MTGSIASRGTDLGFSLCYLGPCHAFEYKTTGSAMGSASERRELWRKKRGGVSATEEKKRKRNQSGTKLFITSG